MSSGASGVDRQNLSLLSHSIEPGAQTVVCPQCGIPHHADCWQENGRCTTFGCQGGGPGVVAAGWATRSLLRRRAAVPALRVHDAPERDGVPVLPHADLRLPPVGSADAIRGAHPTRPHRGGSVLAYGLLSFIPCCGIFFGLAAWTTGNEDLAAMDAGTMETTGREYTEVGRILGIVSVCLQGLALFVMVLTRFSMGEPGSTPPAHRALHPARAGPRSSGWPPRRFLVDHGPPRALPLQTPDRLPLPHLWLHAAPRCGCCTLMCLALSRTTRSSPSSFWPRRSCWPCTCWLRGRGREGLSPLFQRHSGKLLAGPARRAVGELGLRAGGRSGRTKARGRRRGQQHSGRGLEEK